MLQVTHSLILAAFLIMSACAPASRLEAPGGPPIRIVSLDYCADQYVLKLVDRDRILAVSPEADAPYSYMRDAADGLAQVRAATEDVIVLRPDLVVRSYGGGPGAPAMFEAAGIPVLQIGWAATLDDVKAVTRDVANGLGAFERGEAVVSEMERRLSRLQAASPAGSALYITPGGVTTGPGSLIHDMLIAAGLTNFEDAPGWRAIPLEKLAYDHPDLVALGFAELLDASPDSWTPINHPVARNLMKDRPVAALDGALTACGGWFLMDAVEALASANAQ